MPATEKIVQLYQELAECYERLGSVRTRDRFLVLAADAALSSGRPTRPALCGAIS